MGLWYAEKCHDCISNKLLDEILVFGHYVGYLPKDPTHSLFDLLQVQSLRDGHIAGEVGEEDSDMRLSNWHFGHFIFSPKGLSPILGEDHLKSDNLSGQKTQAESSAYVRCARRRIDKRGDPACTQLNQFHFRELG